MSASLSIVDKSDNHTLSSRQIPESLGVTFLDVYKVCLWPHGQNIGVRIAEWAAECLYDWMDDTFTSLFPRKIAPECKVHNPAVHKMIDLRQKTVRLSKRNITLLEEQMRRRWKIGRKKVETLELHELKDWWCGGFDTSLCDLCICKKSQDLKQITTNC